VIQQIVVQDNFTAVN